MSDEEYEGWSNRETWAVALHINNDQGWQESVYGGLREAYASIKPHATPSTWNAALAGEIIRENVETTLSEMWTAYGVSFQTGSGEPSLNYLESVRDDIGSLWRVDWAELGASFLASLAEHDS